MGKANKGKGTTDAQAATPVQGTTDAQRYAPSAKYKGTPATKYGKDGTASTFALLVQAAQANGGTVTYAQARAICADNGDKGFAAYAVRNKYLLPVTDAQ